MKRTTEKRARQLIYSGLRLMTRIPSSGTKRTTQRLINLMSWVMFEEGCAALNRMSRARVYNGTDKP